MLSFSSEFWGFYFCIINSPQAYVIFRSLSVRQSAWPDSRENYTVDFHVENLF